MPKWAVFDPNPPYFLAADLGLQPYLPHIYLISLRAVAFRQRARLVAADHRRGAQRLHRGDLPHLAEARKHRIYEGSA